MGWLVVDPAMSSPLLQPRALVPGGTIRLVAPASPFDAGAVEAGRKVLADMGFTVSTAPDLSRVDRYLAGSDQDRAVALVEALTDPSVDAVLAARGGYGCTRLLPHLDAHLERLQRSPPKLLCGFSDITALHAYLAFRVGWRSVHGPVCTSLAHEPPDSREHLLRVLGGRCVTSVLQGQRLAGSGTVCGRVVGGNLAVLMALAGTRYWPDLNDSVLLLEDVGEKPYRLDRMLTQLLQATGGLSGVLGLALGRFTECNEQDRGQTADQTLDEVLGSASIPVVKGLPIGHAPPNLAVPHGAVACLDADHGTLTLLEEAAHA